MSCSGDMPLAALPAASFAETLAREYERRGGNVTALFAAYAGLVAARDKTVGTDCLIAVDRMISGEGAKP